MSIAPATTAAGRYSLTTRLALLLAVLSFAVIALIGTTLYQMLASQLERRDDAALIARIDQLRTLLKDSDAMALIREKPQIFANMMNNREASLLLRYPGQAPLFEVNPSHRPFAKLQAVAVDMPIGLDHVRHYEDNGVPVSAVSALAYTGDSKQVLEILSARHMYERTAMLQLYQERIWTVALLGALLLAGLGYLLVRHGLQPLRQLASQADAIGVTNLGERLDGRAAPRELAPLVLSLNNMLGRLSEGFSQLKQVSADLAHDLRTPINNLLGQTQVTLARKRNVEEYELLLASNVEEFERLMRMADNMLFLARTEHAQTMLELQELQLGAELQRIADYFEGPAEERGLRIHITAEGKLVADPILLRRALGNLLANAVRHANPDSTIELLAGHDEDGAWLAVENTGPTIAAEHLERLFDRFYRVDAARSDSTQSSGLGLSIVRSIMQLHHGRYAVSSQGGLTRFTLAFPYPLPSVVH